MNQRWLIAIAVIALAAIVGFAAYNAGVHQGVLQSGKVINAPYPYPYPYYWHPFGFFFPFLFLGLLWFFLFRGIFWRGGWRRHFYGYGCGPYPREREDNPDRR